MSVDAHSKVVSKDLRVSSLHVSKFLPTHVDDLNLFAERNHRLRIAVYANFFPVAYETQATTKRKSKIEGLDVDIIKGFCKLMNLVPTFVLTKEFFDLWEMPGEWNKHFDVAIGGIGRSGWRVNGAVEWTMPYFKVHRTVVYNLKDPIHNFPKDVTRKVVGTMGSTGMSDASHRMHRAKKQHLIYYREGSDIKDIKDLLDGRLQGLMRGSFVGKALVARFPDKLGMTKPWKASPKVVGPRGEVFAFPCRRGSGLAGLLNTYLGYISTNGQLKSLIQKHRM